MLWSQSFSQHVVSSGHAVSQRCCHVGHQVPVAQHVAAANCSSTHSRCAAVISYADHQGEGLQTNPSVPYPQQLPQQQPPPQPQQQQEQQAMGNIYGSTDVMAVEQHQEQQHQQQLQQVQQQQQQQQGLGNTYGSTSLDALEQQQDLFTAVSAALQTKVLQHTTTQHPYTQPIQGGQLYGLNGQSADPASSSSSSRSSSSSTGMYGSSSSTRRAKPKNPLGGTYAPGEVWHVRAQPSDLQLQAGLAYTASGPLVVPAEPPQQQQEQHQQQQEQQQPAVDDDVDFVLLDRLCSHLAAGPSGRQHSSSSSMGTYSQSLQQQQQQQQLPRPGGLRILDSSSRRGAGANFRDPAFEQGLSRWMKEAPDWFKIRSVYDRYASRFNIVHVACALSCLADKTVPWLAHKPPPRAELSALRTFTAQLLKTASEQLPSIDAATAAALLHSLARLAGTGQIPAVNKASELIDAVLLHIQPYLSTLSASQLTQLLWSLKLLQHTPPEAWCESLYSQTLAQCSQLKSFEAALLVRALAVIEAPRPPPVWVSAVLSRTEDQLEGMEVKHISLLLLGLGGLKVQPPRAWLSAATTALRSKFDQMGPQSLSNILWAFAKLGVLPERSWLNAFFAASLQLLDNLNRQELSMDMWALSKLQLEPGDQWLDEYFDATEGQLPRFALRDLAIVGYALAKLGLRPPSTWLRRYCALLLKFKAGLYHNKKLLTQVMVSLDSFKVPRMDMWRREMYAAAGYKLYKYRNWRQRAKARPGALAAGAGFSKRRANRRASRGLGLAAAGSRMPPVLRSGDWGVMDAMGGAGGVLGGSMSSYEELAPAPARSAPAGDFGGNRSSSSSSSTGAVKRPLPSTGLVRPQRPSTASSAPSSSTASVADSGSNMGSMWDGI